MKKGYVFVLMIFVFITGMFFSSFLLGQDIAITPPTDQDWQLFFQSIHGVKGFVSLGGAAILTQGLLYLFRSDFGLLLGKTRLVIVTLLTTVSGLLILKAGGTDWASAVMHGSTLAAFQVFLHQFYKQFMEKSA